MPRNDKRKLSDLRNIKVTPNFMPNSEGSCLIEFGRTRVLCTATVQKNVPPFLNDQGRGWLTAEYSMLPGSTPSRKQRERLKSDARSIEIGRLIGRSLRACVDFEALGEITVSIDCDVIQADGGTRTASITGGYIALALAIKKLMAQGAVKKQPLKCHIAAVSAGIVGNVPMLDLCYTEDSAADADMNYVGTEDGEIAEIQVSGEKRTITGDEFVKLVALCREGGQSLVQIQKNTIEGV